MNKYWEHFKTISKHKYYVMKFCFKCGYYKRGLLHDLSKYSFTEFFSSAKYFQGNRSPIDAEKEKNGYSLAWQHHKGHNPHHWEYWIDNVGTFQNTPCKIPFEYIIEMICDWLGAGIVYSKIDVDYDKPYNAPFNYYKRFTNVRIIHQESKELIEFLLDIIEKNGINYFCKTIKKSKKEMEKIYNG